MHTKEPWVVPPERKKKGSPRLAWDSQIIHSDDVSLSAADYARAMACVNALAGIADPVAFMAKVREIVQYEQSNIHDRIDELAAMLPPETAP